MGDELMAGMESMPAVPGIGELAALRVMVGTGEADAVCSCPPRASCSEGASSTYASDVNAIGIHPAIDNPPTVVGDEICEQRSLKPQSGRKKEPAERS